MAIAHIYVDPSIAGNSGAGTIGDPYGDLQYALDTHTRSTTLHTQVNIKAGTGEIMGAAISYATWGAPTEPAQTVFRGYTSAANDGGIGEIDGNNGNFSIETGKNYVHFRDLKLHNTGTANVLDLNWQSAVNCEITNCTSDGVRIQGNDSTSVIGCHIHDCSGVGVRMNTRGTVAHNYFANGTKDFTFAVYTTSKSDLAIHNNIISIDGSTVGISTWHGSVIHNNSILSSAGTGSGIKEQAGNQSNNSVYNNIVEGFSGAGGTGYNWSSNWLVLFRNNAAFNNTTNYPTVDEIGNEGDNEALGATGFAKSGADTFANRFTYFAPADTGNVLAGGYPQNYDKGAVQS